MRDALGYGLWLVSFLGFPVLYAALFILARRWQRHLEVALIVAFGFVLIFFWSRLVWTRLCRGGSRSGRRYGEPLP